MPQRTGCQAGCTSRPSSTRGGASAPAASRLVSPGGSPSSGHRGLGAAPIPHEDECGAQFLTEDRLLRPARWVVVPSQRPLRPWALARFSPAIPQLAPSSILVLLCKVDKLWTASFPKSKKRAKVRGAGCAGFRGPAAGVQVRAPTGVGGAGLPAGVRCGAYK